MARPGIAAATPTRTDRKSTRDLPAAVSLFRPRAALQRAPTMDVNAVLQVAQEAEEYIQKLERNVEALQQEIRALRAHSALVEGDRDRLYAWATWAEAELKRRPKAE